MKAKNRTLTAVMSGLMMVLSGCAEKESGESASYQLISAKQAYEIMAGTEDYVLLDVRTQEEYDEAHIEGALLLPSYDIAARAETVLTDKDALILVYCRSGSRSAASAKKLAELGYTRVYDFGGISGWPYAPSASSGNLFPDEN